MPSVSTTCPATSGSGVWTATTAPSTSSPRRRIRCRILKAPRPASTVVAASATPPRTRARRSAATARPGSPAPTSGCARSGACPLDSLPVHASLGVKSSPARPGRRSAASTTVHCRTSCATTRSSPFGHRVPRLLEPCIPRHGRRSWAGMRVGIDYRPALVNREGIGRYVRELVRGMLELEFGGNLGLFGYTLAGSRFSRDELGLAGARAELVRLRWPSRALPWLPARTKKGVDDLVGGCQVYHHTQYARLAVRTALEVATIHDCLYLKDADYVDARSAERMGAAARELAARAKRILVPSEFVGAEVVLHFGGWPSQVTVTPLGCDHVARALPPGGFPPAKEPYVLTVARVDNRKNHVRMLAAFERLVQEGLPHRWVVAGPRGHGVEHFERALARSPAARRVEWRRDVSEAELPRLYAQADLFLFASLGEGFGLPPLEAMVAGTPVVTKIGRASCRGR